MIRNTQVQATVLTYADTTNDYGERRQSSSSHTSYISLFPYQSRMTDDVRYREVTNIGLTTDRNITDKNVITVGLISYDVQDVVVGKNYNKLLLRKKQ